MTQFSDRGGIRRRGHLQVVGDGFAPPTHQPWCDAAEHTGSACRSTPIELRFGYRGTGSGAVSMARLQLVTGGGPGGVGETRAQVTLNTDVFEFDVEQVAAIGAGFESLLLAMVGLGEQGRELAEKAALIAEARPCPALAGV